MGQGGCRCRQGSVDAAALAKDEAECGWVKHEGGDQVDSQRRSGCIAHALAGCREGPRLEMGQPANEDALHASAAPGDCAHDSTGSYGRLVGHLKVCRNRRLISAEQYRELMAALEDVARPGEGGVATAPAVIHKACTLMDHEFLSSMGLSSTNKESPVLEPLVPVDQGAGGAAASNAMLSDRRFNCRVRGYVEADIEAVVAAYRAPNDLTSRYQVDVSVLSRWLHAIAAQYRPNEYHNWAHALDVFQFCYLGLTDGGGSDFLTYQDILVVFISAIGHDVGHPGTTNPFHVNSGSALALTYNDKSPCENMHASLLFQTLGRDGMNFLENLSTLDYSKTRMKVIDVILATDMIHHFSLVDKITSRVSQKEDNPFKVDTKEDEEKMKASHEDRRILIQAFVHMADIGNSCRPWNVYKALVVALEDEFFAQGDQERALGLPIMPMMDRATDSMALSQDFFLSKLVSPLLGPLCSFMSSDLTRLFRDNLEANRQNWQLLIERHGKLKAKELFMQPLA